jgi:N-acetylmuramoyl-L-alanine amidase
MRFAGETLVIDAGHGGEDGGAVSVSGAVESQINLAIALRLDALMGLYGVNTLMLRSTDISLHDSDASTLRQKKVSDLHNRAAAIEELDDPVVISIHQNTYTDERFHGAQVFYANGQLSLPLAQLTQTALKEALDPENERQPTAVAENVYLMNHISCRAILVECGFLSNPEEDRLLQSSDYQLKLAAVLAGAYLSYQQTEEGETSHVSESQDDFLLYGMRQ